MKKVVFTTGGTGGHIYPALSIARKLREKDTEVLFIGTKHRMEKELVPNENFKFIGLDVLPLRSIISFFKMAGAIFKAIGILRKEKPTEIIGFGNYITIPVLVAAIVLRIPYYLQEQNCTMGQANKYFYKMAKKVFIAFENTLPNIPEKYRSKFVVTGNPLREEFYTKKLSDKFGVKFNIIHVGDYKSYQENLAKDTMSKEAREDSTRILNLNYENFLDIVSLNRKLNRDDLDKIIKDGDLVAASSIDLFSNKLIDKYSYWDNLVTLLGGKDKLISIQDYAKNYYQEATLDDSDNIVYVIPLEGDIVEAQTEIFSGEANINVGETIAKLNTAKENKKIKAVVLRVNSPGGSALTSDIIAEKVKELASEKPVYVSMSSVAASGGYYISANANKIYVDRNTVTGSVGVVSVLVDYSSLLKDNGVNVEKISEGEYSDLYSADTFTEKKYNKIYNSNLKVYEDFLNVVSKGRKIDKERLKELAEGRVWTGTEAVKNGLADEIGGLYSTIYAITEDNDIDDYTVVLAKDKVEIGNIYKKYSRYIKMDKKDLIKTTVFKDYLYNKPVTYLPYDILD